MARDLLAAADAYVELCIRLQTPPHARELALYLALTPSTLTKRFRALYGELSATYLKRRQLETAVRLLRTTTLNIAAIAARSGFGSRETLFRTFRRELHTTPTAYRMEINVTSRREDRGGKLPRRFEVELLVFGSQAHAKPE